MENSRLAAPVTGTSLRMDLLRSLLRERTASIAARLCLEWLARHAGAHPCVALRRDGRQLRVFAAAGLPWSRLAGLALPIGSSKGALASALASPRALRVGPLRELEIASPIAVGILGQKDEPLGLVVAQLPDGREAELEWIASVLGDHLDAAPVAPDGSERSALLSRVLDAVNDPILLTDARGEIVLANARAERLFSLHEDDTEGRRRAIALNEMLFSSALGARAAGTAADRRELALVDPDEGSDLLFELLTSKVEEAPGRTLVVSVLRNITDLGLATQELRAHQLRLKNALHEVQVRGSRLDLIIDSVVDPIVMTDPAGGLVLQNAAAERFFAAPDDTPSAASTRARANQARLSSFLADAVFSPESRQRAELGLVDPAGGETLPFEAVAAKIHATAGNLEAIVTIFHDRREVLERERLNSKLEEAKRDLEMRVEIATRELANQNALLRAQAEEIARAASSKSQFFASMSHEFRTPLNAILGCTQLLLHGASGELGPLQRKNVERIDSNGRSLLAMVTDILDFARLEAGRMPVRPSTFALGGVLDEVTADLAPLIARSRLAVTTDIEPGMPRLRTDRQKLRQILVNLVTNALKFTQEGSVRIQASHAEGHVSVSVADTGRGIPAEEQERIFEEFRQARHSTGYVGTGLGLPISRRFASMLGGGIRVVSAPGEGATFTLEIPLRLPAAKRA